MLAAGVTSELFSDVSVLGWSVVDFFRRILLALFLLESLLFLGVCPGSVLELPLGCAIDYKLPCFVRFVWDG